jgi:hypothetical protein
MESNFGDLIADAMRKGVGADVALTNDGGIRGDRTYDAGTTLRQKDVLSESPFGNATVLTELSGTDLLAMLENGVAEVENKAGRFPQISGMTLVYDPAAPKGSRITEVNIGGKALDKRASELPRCHKRLHCVRRRRVCSAEVGQSAGRCIRGNIDGNNRHELHQRARQRRAQVRWAHQREIGWADTCKLKDYLLCSEQAVARVAQSGNDIGMVV